MDEITNYTTDIIDSISGRITGKVVVVLRGDEIVGKIVCRNYAVGKVNEWQVAVGDDIGSFGNWITDTKGARRKYVTTEGAQKALLATC